LEEKEQKEYEELTFHPRLIAEEKLNTKKKQSTDQS